MPPHPKLNGTVSFILHIQLLLGVFYHNHRHNVWLSPWMIHIIINREACRNTVVKAPLRAIIYGGQLNIGTRLQLQFNVGKLIHSILKALSSPLISLHGNHYETRLWVCSDARSSEAVNSTLTRWQHDVNMLMFNKYSCRACQIKTHVQSEKRD